MAYVDHARGTRRRARRRTSAPPTRTSRSRPATGSTLARLVRAVAQRRRRDRLPRPQGPAGRRRGCSPATATACCSSTAAARATARATPTRGAGATRATSRPRSPSCSDRPDVDPGRIGGLGLSVGGEMMIQAAAETDALEAVVSEGAGMRSVREAVDIARVRRQVARPPVQGRRDSGRRRVPDQSPPANLDRPRREGRAAPAAADYAGEGHGGEGSSTRSLPRRRRAEDALGDPGRRAHRRLAPSPRSTSGASIAFFDQALL